MTRSDCDRVYPLGSSSRHHIVVVKKPKEVDLNLT
jgi:hypothetical protein